MLHDLDARIKLLLLVTMLVALAVLRAPSLLQIFAYLSVVLFVAFLARLSVIRIALTSLLVFPLVGFFSLMVYWAGDTGRAWAILSKSYLSVLTVLVCISTTPLPDLVAAAAFFRFPHLLLGVTQIIYRYLFVLAEQIHTMQIAFEARGGHRKQWTKLAFSGMVAVLFSRSYQKATVVNHAMLSRGYSGSLPPKSFAPFRYRDWGAVALGLGFAIGLQLLS